MIYTLYDIESGKITGTLETTNPDFVKDYSYIEGNYNGLLYYIVDGKAVDRPDLLSVTSINKTEFIANDIDSIIISNVPECTIVIRYEDNSHQVIEEIITDGTIEFQTTYTGTIIIEIDSFPYKFSSIEVEAIDEI